jgi:hypothetical protein
MREIAKPRSAGLKRWRAVCLVVVFAIKSLIAPGYMLAPVDGHARLVMCPAGIHYPAGMHAMQGMTHGMDHAAHNSIAAEQCPFAVAGGVAFVAAAAQVAEPAFVILQPARPRVSASAPVTPPSRYHAPRGPPSLA